MNIYDAFRLLDQGKAVWRSGKRDRDGEELIFFTFNSPNFPKDVQIDNMAKEKFDQGNLLGTFVADYHFTREDIEASDWEVYERPSK